MQNKAPRTDGYAQILLIVALAVVVAIAVFLLVNRNHSAAKESSRQASLSSYCVGRTFAAGDSGHCVRDIQTLVNYMEHSGLTECPFVGGATIAVNGSYDSSTTQQVLAAQHWAGCYAAQEGFTSNIKQTGTVDRTTWGELCTYGYTDPLHTSAKGAAVAIAAGKDASCSLLHA